MAQAEIRLPLPDSMPLVSRPVLNPADYLHEAVVQERWSAFLKPGEIRRARKKGEINHYAFPSGPHYTATDVQEYLDRKYRREPATCGESETTEPGSKLEGTISPVPIPIEAEVGMRAGMT